MQLTSAKSDLDKAKKEAEANDLRRMTVENELQSLKEQFFNRYFWFFNVGTAAAHGILSNLALSGMGTIDQRKGFAVSFIVAAASMVVALLIFLLNAPRYRLQPPDSSALSRFVKVFQRAAMRSWRGRAVAGGCLAMCAGVGLTVSSGMAGLARSKRSVLGGTAEGANVGRMSPRPVDQQRATPHRPTSRSAAASSDTTCQWSRSSSAPAVAPSCRRSSRRT